jgi:hypothetical protein
MALRAGTRKRSRWGPSLASALQRRDPAGPAAACPEICPELGNSDLRELHGT